MNEDELAVIRRAYARQITFAAGIRDHNIEAALSTVRREAFLEPGPWPIMRAGGQYELTPDDDPAFLYQDVLVGMLSKKGLNNGQPSFLSFLISLGRLRHGERAVHIGAGQGYYTAIIAQLVGKTGKVMAIEYEPELAQRASANLADFPNVKVVQGDGCSVALEPSDVIYVNAGAVRPADSWLEAMNDGGRLILPLTVSYTTSAGHAMTCGSIFLIERKGQDYLARWKSESAIYPCFGIRDEISEKALANAFEKGGQEKVARLYRTDDIPEDQSWVRGNGWSLAYS